MLTSSLIGGYVVAIAIDASDNVFITYDNASFHTELLEFAKGERHRRGGERHGVH